MILFTIISNLFHNLYCLSYATVKKDPAHRPPAPNRRRKRSTKSLGEKLQPDDARPSFKDSPFPERQKRSYNINSPIRPPRRGSSSSLADQHKYRFEFILF